MKALSIRQPWAWAIIHAGKDVENRDWSTRYRGAVLIHASKGMTKNEYDEGYWTIECANHAAIKAIPNFKEMVRGGIVGQAEIVDCVEASASPWFFGRYGFVLENAKPLPFRAFKGALGFFDVPEMETT